MVFNPHTAQTQIRGSLAFPWYKFTPPHFSLLTLALGSPLAPVFSLPGRSPISAATAYPLAVDPRPFRTPGVSESCRGLAAHTPTTLPLHRQRPGWGVTRRTHLVRFSLQAAPSEFPLEYEFVLNNRLRVCSDISFFTLVASVSSIISLFFRLSLSAHCFLDSNAKR